MIRVITDGACLGNPGPGGWAAIICQEDGEVEEFSGREEHTTNNRMELLAAIEGLKRIPAEAAVEVVTDSQYLVHGMTEWLAGWKRKGWKTAGGEPVKNAALWQVLDRLAGHRATWVWVKGHAGDSLNERADQIAQARAQDRQHPPGAVSGPPSFAPDSLQTDPISNDQQKQRSPLSANMASIIDPNAFARPDGKTYLSLVDGGLQRHTTWEDCQQRTRNRRGEKHRSCKSLEEELKVIEEWGLTGDTLLALAKRTPQNDDAPLLEKPVIEVEMESAQTTPAPALLSMAYLPAARQRMIAQGFSERPTTNPTEAYRLQSGSALLVVYRSGNAIQQGEWNNAHRQTWQRVAGEETSRLEDCLRTPLEVPEEKHEWSDDEVAYLYAALLRDWLAGWRSEPIGRCLMVLRSGESAAVGWLRAPTQTDRVAWERVPSAQDSKDLRRASWKSRLQPYRWCAAQAQLLATGALALAAFPLTISAQRLAAAWDWDKVKAAPGPERQRILGLIEEHLPDLKLQCWSAEVWKPMAEQMGNQLDLVAYQLCEWMLSNTHQAGPLELIRKASGNQDWAHRLVDGRSRGSINYRPPALPEEHQGEALAAFLASVLLSEE